MDGLRPAIRRSGESQRQAAVDRQVACLSDSPDLLPARKRAGRRGGSIQSSLDSVSRRAPCLRAPVLILSRVLRPLRLRVLRPLRLRYFRFTHSATPNTVVT